MIWSQKSWRADSVSESCNSACVAWKKEADPAWIDPVGQRVTLACRCDTPEEVDQTYALMLAAGHTGRQAPWDAFWGQRYALLADPDGNRVDLFAATTEAGRE